MYQKSPIRAVWILELSQRLRMSPNLLNQLYILIHLLQRDENRGVSQAVCSFFFFSVITNRLSYCNTMVVVSVPAIPTFLENTRMNPKINIMRFSAGCHLCETQWGVNLVCLGQNLKFVFTSGKKLKEKMYHLKVPLHYNNFS